MKTESLITFLASHAPPVKRREVELRFVAAHLGALAFVMLLMLAALGPRPDIASATRLAMFWWKLAIPAAVAACAWVGLRRLGYPGVRLGRSLWPVGAILLLVWMASAMVLSSAVPAQRGVLLLGQSGGACAATIAGLALPALAAALWAQGALAPTRPALTGAVAGVFAGACAAFVYALHCTEMALPFFGAWYTVGILLPTAIGALAGPKLLRW